MPLLLLLLTVVAALGSVAGVVVALRSARAGGRSARSGLETGLPRVEAVVHAGPEKVLVVVQRELGLSASSGEAPYGGFYLEAQSDERVLVRTRSEIGRGFVAVLAVRRLRSSTSSLEYSIVRLPGDEDLHDAVLAFELRLILAVRRVDRHADIRLRGTALRDIIGGGSDARR